MLPWLPNVQEDFKLKNNTHGTTSHVIAKTYSVLVNDIDNDDELSIVFAVVDEGDPSDLNEPLERLQNQ